jgi:hypothetical protein
MALGKSSFESVSTMGSSLNYAKTGSSNDAQSISGVTLNDRQRSQSRLNRFSRSLKKGLKDAFEPPKIQPNKDGFYPMDRNSVARQRMSLL